MQFYDVKDLLLLAPQAAEHFGGAVATLEDIRELAGKALQRVEWRGLTCWGYFRSAARPAWTSAELDFDTTGHLIGYYAPLGEALDADDLLDRFYRLDDVTAVRTDTTGKAYRLLYHQGAAPAFMETAYPALIDLARAMVEIAPLSEWQTVLLFDYEGEEE
jgi:hypothetical protein